MPGVTAGGENLGLLVYKTSDSNKQQNGFADGIPVMPPPSRQAFPKLEEIPNEVSSVHTPGHTAQTSYPLGRVYSVKATGPTPEAHSAQGFWLKTACLSPDALFKPKGPDDVCLLHQMQNKSRL